MRRYRILSVPAVVVALVGSNVAGCGNAGSPVVSDNSAAPAALDETDCTEFRGHKHCPLGDAKLDPRDDSVLNVTGLNDPNKDGVAILLPQVTSFAPDGRIDAGAAGSTVNASAYSAGRPVSTMGITRTGDAYAVSANFTGTIATGKYNVNLYNNNQLVVTIPHVPSGTQILFPYWRPSWWFWYCWCWWWYPPHFRVDPLNGACIWTIPLPEGEELRALNERGEPLMANRIELVEDVNGGGSYPYMAFDRIDYSTAASWMLLGDENTQGQP